MRLIHYKLPATNAACRACAHQLVYLQQAIELSASDNGGIGKKKLVDAAKPVAFRRLSYVQVPEEAASKESMAAASAPRQRPIARSQTDYRKPGNQ